MRREAGKHVAGQLALLGLRPGASLRDVKRAYRNLAKTCHPDSLPAGVDSLARRQAEEQFKRISVAYQWLLDNRKELGPAAAPSHRMRIRRRLRVVSCPACLRPGRIRELERRRRLRCRRCAATFDAWPSPTGRIRTSVAERPEPMPEQPVEPAPAANWSPVREEGPTRAFSSLSHLTMTLALATVVFGAFFGVEQSKQPEPQVPSRTATIGSPAAPAIPGSMDVVGSPTVEDWLNDLGTRNEAIEPAVEPALPPPATVSDYRPPARYDPAGIASLRLHPAERAAIDLACGGSDVADPRCVENELAALAQGPRFPAFPRMHFEERAAIEVACEPAMSSGVVAYNRCLIEQIALLKIGPRFPAFPRMHPVQRNGIEQSCQMAKREGAAAYNRCLIARLSEDGLRVR